MRTASSADKRASNWQNSLECSVTVPARCHSLTANRALFGSIFQAALVGPVARARHTAPGRQGPRRVARPGRAITRSGRRPRARAARWMEDRRRIVEGNEARVLGRAGDRSGIGEDEWTAGNGPVAIALGHDGRHCRKRDGRVSGAERPGAGSCPRGQCLVVRWKHRPVQDQSIESDCLRWCLRPRGEVVGRTTGSCRGGRGDEEHQER